LQQIAFFFAQQPNQLSDISQQVSSALHVELSGHTCTLVLAGGSSCWNEVGTRTSNAGLSVDNSKTAELTLTHLA